MTNITIKSFNVNEIYISQYWKPSKIGGKKALVKFLKDYGVTTVDEYDQAVSDCLVVVRRGKVYYNASTC